MTFLFTDIEGSTRLAQLLGDGYRPVLHEHRRLLRHTLVDADGAELLTEGDSFFIAFGDAASALSACAQAQRALATHGWPAPTAAPRVRMGLHTGYAIPQAGEYASYEVHRAARVAAAAHGGQVLCSAATRHAAIDLPTEACLIDLGLHRLRGFDDRERLYQLVAPGLERHFPRPRTAAAANHNLPAGHTAFIGRGSEQAELRRLIANHRLVTVCGPGGAGKTRLATALAAELVESYLDGVWYCDLGEVTDPSLVAVNIAAGLGLRPEPGRPAADTLAEFLSGRRCLLLLDACEHLMSAAAPLVRRLLADGADLSVLATSREPLNLPGEVVWRIPPLSLTSVDGEPSDAVALLVDRATAARGGHPPSPPEIKEFDDIAARLDGLPLALELAAARLRALSAEQLATRLDDVHGSLRSTLDASYQTLPEPAARLLRWLSAFAGPVNLRAVEWIVPGADDVLDSLAALVDKSLITVERGATGTAYAMLDPIRAFAAHRRAEHDEDLSTRTRHLAWCLAAVRQTHLDDAGGVITWSVDSVDPLAIEIRAGLDWSVSGGSVGHGLRLAAAVAPWWRERGLAREGRVWLYRLYKATETAHDAGSPQNLAAALHAHAQLADADGQHTEQLTCASRAELIARRIGDAELLARILGARALALLRAGFADDAERLCAQALDVGATSAGLTALCTRIESRWRRGDLRGAAALLPQARGLEVRRSARRGLRAVDLLEALVEISRGRLDAAAAQLAATLSERLRYGYQRGVIETLRVAAVWLTRSDQHALAAYLWGAADARGRDLRVTRDPYRSVFVADFTALQSALGESFAGHYHEGAEMDLDEVSAATLEALR